MTIDFARAADLAATLDRPIGPSPWLEIGQGDIDAFAEATGDRQWIHVDVERAAREAPGGRTIAHGYLLLALLGRLQPLIYVVGAGRVLNVGLSRLRFLTPVPAASRVRLIQTVKAAEPQSNGLRITSEAVLELEGSARPAMIAEIIFLYFD